MIKIPIKSKKRDKAGFTHLVLAKPNNYTHKLGQYVYLKVSETQTKALAIASHPSEPQLLFLFRGEFEHSIVPHLSQPQGDGFRCVLDKPQRMLFITHGTGITALRGIIIERKRLGFTHDTLLYGSRHADEEPELDCLQADFGVKQLRAYSSPPEELHLQDILRGFDVDNFDAVLLAGSTKMLSSCRQILYSMKYSANKIFTNY
ncbi:MAG TPA: FAD-dependent oxidoreductase [Turneriella sp.]|nr:FAD-dependent oxidoreductase [Turneriella sp.]